VFPREHLPSFAYSMQRKTGRRRKAITFARASRASASPLPRLPILPEAVPRSSAFVRQPCLPPTTCVFLPSLLARTFANANSGRRHGASAIRAKSDVTIMSLDGRDIAHHAPRPGRAFQEPIGRERPSSNNSRLRLSERLPADLENGPRAAAGQGESMSVCSDRICGSRVRPRALRRENHRQHRSPLETKGHVAARQNRHWDRCPVPPAIPT